MAYVFETFDSSGKPHPRKRYQYTDWRGKRQTGSGTSNWQETVRIAERRQAHENEIRDGIRPQPKLSDQARDISKTIEEYTAWGEFQGGRGGMPWSVVHARQRKYYLRFWIRKLGIQLVSELNGILPKVERTLRELQAEGKSGKTIQNHATGLKAFCEWCCAREYLDSAPLKRLAKFDARPRTQRRALTFDEIQKILAIAPETRRSRYLTAILSGLRAGELRNLKVKNLDTKRGGFALESTWTKNRKPGFQPLPLWLVNKLAEEIKGRAPEENIFNIGKNAAKTLYTDMRRAGIDPKGPDGKVDFHALRVCYVTQVFESGANAKEAQTLARHSTPEMTMMVYGRTREDRLSQVVENMGKIFDPDSKKTKQEQQQTSDSGTPTPDKTLADPQSDSIPFTRFN